MTHQQDIIPMLHDASLYVDYGQLTMTLRQQVQVAVDLVNHLGEVFRTSNKTFKDEILIDMLTRWDVPQMMMTTNPYKTIDRLFDDAKDRAAQVLFDMSMTHSAVGVSWYKGEHDSSIVIWLDESPDHQTNLDAEFIDLVLDIIERKRLWWRRRMLLHGMNMTGELF